MLKLYRLSDVFTNPHANIIQSKWLQSFWKRLFFSIAIINYYDKWLQSLLIFLTRDVEGNPRPKPNSWRNISICHWNFSGLPAHIYVKLELLKVHINFHKFVIISLSKEYSNVNLNNLELAFLQDLIIYPILSKEMGQVSK